MGKTIMGTTNFFKEEQERFKWMTKPTVGKNYNRSDKDISISKVFSSKADKEAGKNVNIAIVFRNHSRHAVTETQYVLMAVVKNRIFFKTGEQNNGLLIGKVSTNCEKSGDNGYLRTRYPEYVEQLLPFIGSYDLKYDKFYELYYIEKEETEE